MRADALAEQKPVPRFFIDLHDGANLVRDHDGFDLPDLAAARTQAVRMMTRLAQGLTDPLERQDFVIAVRDAQGAVRLRLRLSYDIEPG
ncbi:hypothetical protein FOHLNKBM_5727 [Methylobacterium longum]|nr:hypothetical protein FOHLNKBM_5727 [Methylobacterium longum]